MLTVREALTRATGQLSAHPHLRPTALADATLLLLGTLGLERASLLAHPERLVDRELQARYQRLLERRLAFEPIQYILGTQEFFGLALRVTPAVLIPRPETELLVEAVLALLPRDIPQRIVDVGTGSGAIAIALAHELPHASITAVDLSSEALAIALENAATHNVEQRVRFVQSDLLSALANDPPYDAIVSNPPYIPTADAPALHPQVRDHEPADALFAGPTGLEVYERLIPQAAALLQPGGVLALEIGHGQRQAVTTLLTHWSKVVILEDLQQIPRIVLARHNSAPSRSSFYNPAYQS